MGDIADSMINGEFDFITGEYIGRPTCYPRTRSKTCKNGNPKKGISMWLTNNGIPKKEQFNILSKFINESTEHNVEANSTKYYLCVIASCNFNVFRKWVLNHIKTNGNGK